MFDLILKAIRSLFNKCEKMIAEVVESLTWNNLKDKPFGEETRTTILDTVVILDADGDGSAFVTTPLEAVPVVGAKYRVRWADSYYDCEGQDLSASLGQPCVAIGNLGMLSGSGDSGEPFVIALVPDGIEGEDTYAQVICLDSYYLGVHVGLVVEMVEISQIPKEYFSKEFPPTMIVNITGGDGSINDTDGWVSDKTFYEILSAAITGCMVFFKYVTRTDETLIMPLTKFMNTEEGQMIFFGIPWVQSSNHAYAFMSDGSFVLMN